MYVVKQMANQLSVLERERGCDKSSLKLKL